MMQRVFIYGKEHCFRLISEFSLTDMKVEVFDKAGQHSLSGEALDQLQAFEIGGLTYKKLWQRQESDERGGYTAVALTYRRTFHIRRRVN